MFPFEYHLFQQIFSLGSRVQCAARAVSLDGDAGLELNSIPVTISKEWGLCAPKYKGSVGAEPFTAKMRYTGMRFYFPSNRIREVYMKCFI